MSMDNIAILEALKERFDLDTENSKILVVGLGHTGVSVAYYLQKLGYGMMSEAVSAAEIDQFLLHLPDFTNKLSTYSSYFPPL